MRNDLVAAKEVDPGVDLAGRKRQDSTSLAGGLSRVFCY